MSFSDYNSLQSLFSNSLRNIYSPFVPQFIWAILMGILTRIIPWFLYGISTAILSSNFYAVFYWILPEISLRNLPRYLKVYWRSKLIKKTFLKSFFKELIQGFSRIRSQSSFQDFSVFLPGLLRVVSPRISAGVFTGFLPEVLRGFLPETLTKSSQSSSRNFS